MRNFHDIGNKRVKSNSEYSHNVTMLLDFLEMTFFVFCLSIYFLIHFFQFLDVNILDVKVSNILVVQVRLPVTIRQENLKPLYMLYLFSI